MLGYFLNIHLPTLGLLVLNFLYILYNKEKVARDKKIYTSKKL